MIVREDGDALILVPQTEHSRLVGQMAARWGNAQFAPPRPFESIARAATFHDFGWLRYETAPELTVAGRVADFRHVPATPEQLDALQWCIDWMSGIDPYAGLITNMHRTGLWRNRYEVIRHPPMHIGNLDAAMEEFIARNETRQRRERGVYDDAEVWTNYHLLQVWDELGLYFTCQDPTVDYIDPVPVTYSDAREGVRMTLTPRDATTVAFDPFPFNARPCQVQVVRKRLAKSAFTDVADFRRAYFQAATELVTFTLI